MDATANDKTRIAAHAAPPARRAPVGLLVIVILLLGAGLVVGILPRLKAREILKEQAEGLSIPTVTVLKPKSAAQASTFSLPGDVRPLMEAPIYARTNGYVKRWLVDLGGEVKAGDLLAELDTPELNHELENARAKLSEAEAAAKLARTTSGRFSSLRKTSVISSQEADEKDAEAATRDASVQAATADVRRLENLKGFQKIVAPFDGVITERNTDVGQLVSAGGENPLFRLTQSRTLRVFVRVPEAAARKVTIGQAAEVRLAEYPGKKFEAKVVRTSGAIDMASRTLRVELELDNAEGALLAGSHADVRFQTPAGEPVLTLPSNALLFRSEGAQAGVVVADGKVQLRSLTLGRDFGRDVEVLSGVGVNDQVILNPSDSLTDGAQVRVAEAKAPAPAGGAGGH